MLRNYKLTRKQKSKRNRGQSLVEFALVGVILFSFLLGIIDAGRLLFAYSVLSNAAQEGSRYGVVRPRDVLGPTDATRVAQNTTLTPVAQRRPYLTPQLVASDTTCNIFGKTRENVFGLTAADVNVAAWYDDGGGTPYPVPTTIAQQTSTPYMEIAAVPGNRVVVEASYHFDFIVPYFRLFIPNGINVNMRSARTILSRGDITTTNCLVNYTPAPTYTPSDTPTPSNTRTTTSTPTSTNTPIPCGLGSAFICRRGITSSENWNAYITVSGYQAGDSITAFLTGQAGNGGTMTCDGAGNCSFASSGGTQRAGPSDTVTFTYSPGGGRSCTPLTLTTGVFPAQQCSGLPTVTPASTYTPTSTNIPTNTPTHTYTRTVTRTRTTTGTPSSTGTFTATYTPTSTSTSTPTFTRTNTPTVTFTFTRTNTPILTSTATPTNTRTNTITPTRTKTPSALLITNISPLKPSGSNKRLDIRVHVTDDNNVAVTGATVTGSASGPGGSWSGSLADQGGGDYQICGAGNYNNGTITVNITAAMTGYASASGSATAGTGNWCP